MKKFLLRTFLFVIVAAANFEVRVQAQATNNNDFANAYIVPGAGTNTVASNVGATTQTGEPTRVANQRFGASVWWRWTAPASGATRVSTIGSSFDTVLGVYTGALGSLTTVAENNNGGPNNTSLLTFNATQGVQYQILVGGFRLFNGAEPATGQIQFSLSLFPTATITTPANGAVIPVGTSFNLVATASTPSPPVVRVDFYRNNVLIGSDTTSPYSMVVSNSPLGTNTLVAVVTDSAQQVNSSAAVNIAVLSPGVTIVSPSDGASYLRTDPITVNAVGVVSSGSMTNIAFYVDGVLFGQSAAAPFGAVWSSVTPGVHRLTAIGKDTSSVNYTSTPVLISVGRTLVSSNSVWKYLDTGGDPGPAWVLAGYDDSAWLSGPAPLGYGDSNGRQPLTVPGFGPDAQNKFITTQFRQLFVVTNVASYTNLILHLERDDGAVIYLNGIEVARNNLPGGTITTTTLASQNAADDGTTVVTISVPVSRLVEGTNILAVEIHQDAVTSSDIWMVLDAVGLPLIVRNQPPSVALTTPANNDSFLQPASIAVSATASDADGTVTNVVLHIQDIYGNDLVVGSAAQPPYQATWNSPTQGWYSVYAVATDDLGASSLSEGAFVTVYDSLGTPRVEIFTPTNQAVYDGPTNVSLFAGTTSPNGVTNVEFWVNGSVIGQLPSAPTLGPVSAFFTWTNAAYGTDTVRAVSYDATGSRGTSAPVSFIVNPPPPNLSAPTIATVSPVREATTNILTSIQVTFSERVVGVNASDLIINTTPASTVTGSGSNYTFTFPQPPFGVVDVYWADNSDIVDLGFPPRPFDTSGFGADWQYHLVDLTPPTILSRNPAAGSTLTTLNQIAIAFSEPVSGVDAADLLINGSPAIGLSGGGANYIFSFPQPAPGTVTISWAANPGIFDLSDSPNAFNAAGSSWTYSIDNRSVLVQSNGTWRFIKAFAEASAPIDAWRQEGFNDSSWTDSLAPFYYGDPYNSVANPGTLLSDMQGGAYSSIYMRSHFFLNNAAAATNLYFNAQSDDGFIAWINGVEVVRYNMAAGDIPYNGSALTAINEPNNSGAAYILYTLNNVGSYLVDGTNVLAIHAFNNQPATSSDFGINAQLYTFLVDPSVVPPRIASVSPAAGTVFYLTNITVGFSEPVSGVDAADLRVNGSAATSLLVGTNNTYTFRFNQPAYGNVAVLWAPNHGIQDFDVPPKAFDGTAAGSIFQYTLLNPSTPTIVSQVPAAGATVSNLTQVTVTFSEPVTNVDPDAFLVNGIPATGISGGPTTFTFSFPQPAFGNVTIGWVTGSGITDLDVPPNPFDISRPGSTWSYSLQDLTPPTIISRTPAAGASVTNLTAITVSFSEPVSGVNAGDLLLNGVPATGLSGSGAGPYTFTFAQPNAVVINVSWAVAHGIRDLAASPNLFNASGAGATWSYLTPDNVAPTVASIDPSPFVTLRALTSLRVTFTEPVFGVDTNDLLINNRRATQVTGSGAGPYTFNFLSPTNGPVEVRWVSTNGITDLASPPNSFSGGEWTYILDPNASFAGNVVFSEIMFDPPGGSPTNEWVELHNVTSGLINLAGWQFTKGVGFTFPNTAIPAHGYLVVAANVAAFQARYPTVTNVVGGWTGSLANSAETLELKTALGESVNAVSYASEGDWAQRERGNGASAVTSITRAGSTATVSIFDHGYNNGDQVVITGADQPEYNGRFVVAGAASTSFTITVSGNPASPATGTMASHLVQDNGASGWAWYSPAAGFGSSLELANDAVPNSLGQNWLASLAVGGTPGRANSVATNNIAPRITDVTHFPPIPRSTDAVSITARVRDELSNGVAGVTLFYRNHTSSGPGGFTTAPMFDDGAHADGVSGDGLYGAIVPAQANGSVVEFYVQSSDTSGLVRTWPAPSYETNGPTAAFGAPGQYANALYQVDNEIITNTMPAIRIVLSGTEKGLFPPADRNSDASPNCTLVSTDGEGTKIRYLCDTRVRGAGTRTRTPPNNRIGIPSDNPWNGLNAFNLNSQYVHAQLLGGNLALKSGVPAEVCRVVQYRINGGNPAPITAPSGGSGAGWGTFLLLEPPNGDLSADLYPLDGGGNLYRASTANHNADLSYQNGIPANYLGRGYYKTSNRTENDWSDMAALTFAFSLTGANSDYVNAISTNVNVVEWMRYFAVASLMNYGETSLANGIGDDYALYRGDVDKRFLVVAHDFDTIFGQGDTGASYYPIATNSSIFIMLNPPNGNANVPNLRRFITNNAFAPIFYGELQRLCDTTFHPTNLNPFIDQLLTTWNGPAPDAGIIAGIKSYAANRRTIALSQINLALTVGSSLSVANGYLSTTTPLVTLFGSAHAIETRSVLVNGSPAGWNAYEARWTNNTSLVPGINRVLVQSLNSNGVEFARATIEIWYDDSSVQSVSGSISSDTVWSAAAGPYNVTAGLTIASGATLTIQPGTTLYLNSGVNITVANGGRLLAEGTDVAPIRFTRTPGTAANWGGITVNGAVGSPETRIAYAHFEFNGSTAIHSTAGTLFLDHLTFGNTAVQYISLDGSSFVVQHCVFPAITGSFEPVHGTSGIKAGGRGIVRRNFWGRITGYNDAFDFTGGNRPGPILQVINNVFAGSDDDLLDLDSTDAWIEGNIFLHCHRNGASPDSSSAVSGGSDNADNSQITILGNIFYDCDQAANAKQTNFYTFINNTIVHQSRVGSIDTNAAVVILADDTTSQGAGMYLDGNIIYDAENLTRNVTTAIVTFTNNIITLLQGTPWSGPGGSNVNVDPLFVRVPQLSDTTNFTTWAEAQVMKEWFALRAGSPAAGTGPNGVDKGALIPYGVSISGEPAGSTPFNTATLRVSPVRTGSGIPPAGFPNGSGFTHYKWRLDGGLWSAETPAATPINLSGLGNGPHYVEVSGKNDAGFYQDDPVFGSDAAVTVSRTWTVSPASSTVRLNEILASNGGSLIHTNTTPDAIELLNTGPAAVDLTGLRLTTDPANPDKYIFPSNTTIAAGAYLTVFANNPDGTPGIHVGFSLNQGGDSLYLYDAAGNGGALLDSVKFGLQITDLSIGRLADGSWALTRPTFGAANRAAATGDPMRLRINEWLAIAVTPFSAGFLELYNGDPLPVALGDFYLSDEPLGWPSRHQMPRLSFIAGNGYLRLIADGNASAGADHVNFHLDASQGALALYLPDLTLVDCVFYQPQLPNISQGRSPNGSSNIVFLSTPTPGAPNPLITVNPGGGALVINEVLANNASLTEPPGSRTPDWIELYNGTASSVSLADLSLTDDTLQPRRFVFGAGVTLAAGGYLRILCDDGVAATNNNTGFALKSTGGGVYLFDRLASGGSLLNAVVYGLQTPNLSIGRIPNGGTNWTLTSPTPGTINFAVPTLGDVTLLKVNEWMADPGAGKDDWFEIYNPGSLPVALGGLYLTDVLDNRTKHVIPALSYMGTGTNAWQRFQADGNVGAGADHVSFSLRAQGEAVGISTTNGTLIDGYAFGQQILGVSEGRFPDGSTNIVSFPGTDSPGAANYRLLTEVVINEVLSHTDEPLEDAIELRNLTGQSINIGGWWLSDDNGTLQKYQIPFGTTLPANGFAVIYETHFTNLNEASIPFALSSQGDEVVLSAAAGGVLTGFRTGVKFGAAQNAVSFGRYITSDAREEFVAMSSRTFGADDPGSVVEFRTGTGAANAYPKVGPVVISEIMYRPPDIGTNDNAVDEFIELHNITTAAVPLYDVSFPTNVWHLRDAVDFDFASGTTIPGGGYLLVVGFDPVNNPSVLASFRAKYHVDLSVPVVGPWNGRLANDNEDIELRRPDAPNLNVVPYEVPYILVEHVHYYDVDPWPAGADGTGQSLQRLSDNLFGNDPANWTAGAPTAGPQYGGGDTDGDGLPDSWESLYNLDPFNAADAALDSDGDGLTNLQEYQLGTNPRDAQSGLQLFISLAASSNVQLSFSAVSNLSYAVEYTTALGAPWQLLEQFAVVPTNRVVTRLVPASGTARFFRLKLSTATLHLGAVTPLPGQQVSLTVEIPAGQAATLLFSPNMPAVSWNNVTSFPAASTNRLMQVTAPAPGMRGFYRLQSP